MNFGKDGIQKILCVRSLCYGISFRKNYILCRLPGDIWHVDLDSNKLTPPSDLSDEIPPLPEPEGTILKNHLKQVGHLMFVGLIFSLEIFFIRFKH